MHDEYLTPAQIAVAAGNTYHTVLNAIKEGKLEIADELKAIHSSNGNLALAGPT